VDVLAHKLPDTPFPAPDAKGVLLTFAAKDEHVPDVEKFLIDAQSFVEEERGTTVWFAFRRENGDYGIFGVFPDNTARLSHLTGHVPRELAKHALTLLGGVPEIHLVDVQAEKLTERVSA
jgi:hypothetical protein